MEQTLVVASAVGILVTTAVWLGIRISRHKKNSQVRKTTKETNEKIYEIGVLNFDAAYNDLPLPDIEMSKKAIKAMASDYPRHSSMGGIIYNRKKFFSQRMDDFDKGRVNPDQTDPYSVDEYVEGNNSMKWNVVSSRLDINSDYHAPVLDFDFPVAVVKSKTPGHFHVYFETALTKQAYRDILETFYRHGLIGLGNLNQFNKTGATYLRRGPYEALIAEQEGPEFVNDMIKEVLDWEA